MGIIAKTGERVIVVDPKSGAPFALMGLDEYERLVVNPVRSRARAEGTSPSRTAGAATSNGTDLTQNPGAGMMDPDLALLQEAKQIKSDWGGDEEKEEDRYYMEPTE
ncbi:hypothetical protein A3H11_03575 [Candidatus Uhrbacteria bacterium RIFCSPLOWO2_12_FULL_47_10]|nr:MAG: hypothetical protein A3J03_04035 [Candidatus Uhrbacteria bacterium RIFCSPLOWO2_02_FULL_46_25]OGL93547.1 MAG: hypothetical protein A3H11_03575 [Candidatus Uhrbacteria bacterium RIFCSPLOWO2_12_FULL_47_10]